MPTKATQKKMQISIERKDTTVHYTRKSPENGTLVFHAKVIFLWHAVVNENKTNQGGKKMVYTKTERKKAAKKAWRTRRKKYGKNGVKG